ncbi:hypothetical protein GDO81_010565 [Engystomops pustulosus]|uniref:GrpE protein homolog n=1 Tax=Engystomops pustulosus TaxID=76066 RepID=A0AAV7C0Y6_ENGPU|nr:hypothetical protein GDO81_010565 [Engystomops pustulosus]
MAGLKLKSVAEQLRSLVAQGTRLSRCPVCASSTAPQQRNTGGQTTAQGGTNDPTSVVKALEKKTVKLEAEIRDLTERYERAVADSDNVRQRTRKFVEDAKLFGIQSFCRDLVEVADILESAVNETKQKGMTDAAEMLGTIEAKLHGIFTKHGLRKMTPVGGNYDPYDHEVVAHVPAEGRRPGSVATIKQDGYKLHGRTIRHAHVSIAVETQR